MVEHFFEVVLSNRAKDDYQKIRSDDRLARLLRKIPDGKSTHLERTQAILKQLKEPRLISLDQKMVGKLSFILSRTESSTCIYFRRSKSGTVTVIHICESTLDYTALAEVVFSGDVQVLSAIGIGQPPPLARKLVLQ